MIEHYHDNNHYHDTNLPADNDNTFLIKDMN